MGMAEPGAPYEIEERKLRRAFLEEAEELLEKLNGALVELERQPGNAQLVHEIFRLTHSLKSEAALLDFTHLSEVAHRLEDVFDRIRSGSLELTRPLLDTIFSASDIIHELVRRIGSGQGDGGVELTSLLSELAVGAGLMSATPVTAPPAGPEAQGPGLGELERMQVLEALDRGETLYELSFGVEEKAETRYLRAYLVLNNLEKIANVIRTQPPLASPEGEDGRYGRVVILLSSALPEERILKAGAVDLITDVRLVRWDHSGVERSEPGPPGGPPVGETARGGFGLPLQPEGGGGERMESASVRVGTRKLNEIWQLVGELVMCKAQLGRLHESVLKSAASDGLREELARADDSLERIASGMQQAIMETRMVPIAVLFNKLPRLVRDLSRKLGKSAELRMEGKGTEIDRGIVEVLSDPLTHIIRNALDHGIEPPAERRLLGKPESGCITISARQQGGTVAIEVRDDGAGLDTEKIRRKAGVAPETSDEEAFKHIFAPGFSTKEDVTDVSGRGVGLDVVATRIRDLLKGEVVVKSERGKGLLIRILLPLTLTILHSLVVRCRRQHYAIPARDIDETLQLGAEQLQSVTGRHSSPYGGGEIPVQRLAELLGEEQNGEGRGERPTSAGEGRDGVIIQQQGRRICLLVDELCEEQDVVIKPVPELLNLRGLFSGVSVLGDGRILFVLDCSRLVELAS
jgi:two-component system chemotaxis sensor kinase CheA